VNIAVAIAGLAFLILIHEAGHFVVALAVRMRPRRFYIFFPPALVKKERNGIEYGIGAIPLGGYVKIPGMHKPAARDVDSYFAAPVAERPQLLAATSVVRSRLEEESWEGARAELQRLEQVLVDVPLTPAARKAADRGVSEIDDALSPDAYWRAPVWKRVAVILAGPGTNLVFALAALAVVFALGVPVASQIEEVTPGSPASTAGLRPGDEILAVDGQAVSPVLTEQLPSRIAASGGDPMTIEVERSGETLTLGPVRARLDEGVYRVGIRLRAEEKTFGPWESVELAARETWAITAATGETLGRIFTGSGRDEVSSPVGIVRGSAEAVDVGFDVYLRILALISLSLALLNLLPLLPLDGGHIAFSLLEGIRGRAVPREAYERASAVGIVLVLFLFFIGLNNDLGGGGGG
jgi:regulator of sigma E protease